MAYNVRDALTYDNIADQIDDDVLKSMAASLIETVEADDRSRQGWLNDQEEWLKLASQVKSTKSYPWQNAANVKYPLMTIACTQFHARALPSLINSSEPVMTKIVGKDPDGTKLKRASRVRTYMSYQVMEDMPEWLDEFDRLLFVLPMVGTVYKKTYYSAADERIKSVMILPKDVIVNYNAQTFERARKTHVLYMENNEVTELQRLGIFRDIELSDPEYKVPDPVRDETLGFVHSDEEEDLRRIYEVHGWWDLDEDGYAEPYIITVDQDATEILRIDPRFDDRGVRYSPRDPNQVAKITPLEHFTAYIFLPDPNSSVYGIGFGSILGPTNEAVNTLINQLIDAGTLANMQGGFITRGAKIKGGATRFKPGEWKIVNTSAADLKNSIVPLPVQQPSATLFQLLNLLINSGERISAVSDMMVGESPGQNQPATTSMAVLEQGLKVFTGIYKRIFRQLKSEYRKIYYLNGIYLDEEHYQEVLDDNINQELDAIAAEATPEELAQVQMALEAENAMVGIDDFSPEGLDIIPSADPNLVTDAQRMIKSQALIEKLSMGLPVNPAVVLRRALEAEQQEDIDEIMEMPPQPPSKDELELELEAERLKNETRDSIANAIEKLAKAESLEEGTQIDIYSRMVQDLLAVKQVEQGPQNGDNPKTAAGNPPTPA